MKFLSLALVAATTFGLQAQDVRFGVQASLNQPQSDLKDAVDSKLGFGVGAHALVDFGSGHALRPRVDYLWFPEYNPAPGTSLKVNNLSAGADYLYFVEGKQEGIYFTGGLSVNRWKAEATAIGFSSSDTTTKLGIAAGLGYQFNKALGAEVRYQKGKADEADFDFIQVAASFRF